MEHIHVHTIPIYIWGLVYLIYNWFINAGTSSQHQQFIVQGRASVLEVVHIAISQASEKIPKVVSCDSLEMWSFPLHHGEYPQGRIKENG